MKIEKGKLYRLEGWGEARVLSLYQSYESFNPDVEGDQKIRLCFRDEPPFAMRRQLFERIVTECIGYYKE